MTIYLIKFTVLSFLFWGFYRLILHEQKNLEFNRVYLISSLVLSMVIPMITISYVIQDITPALNPIINPIVSNLEQNPGVNSTTYGQEWISWMYVSIVSILALRFLFHLLVLLYKSMTCERSHFQGTPVILTKQEHFPFAFLNYIFVDKDAFINDQLDHRILIHEIAHIRQRHTWDILFVEVMKVAFWFNPVLWIYKNEIKMNHEYLADNEVIKTQDNIKDYQYLLLSLANIGLPKPSILSNHINYSITKKRLEMMFKTRERHDMRWRMLCSFCFALVMTFAFHQKSYAQSSGASPEEISEYKSIIKKSWNQNGEMITIRLIDANRMREISAKFNREQAERFKKYEIPEPPPPPAPPMPSVIPPPPPAPAPAPAPSSSASGSKTIITTHSNSATPLPLAPVPPKKKLVEFSSEDQYNKYFFNGKELDYQTMEDKMNATSDFRVRISKDNSVYVTTEDYRE